MAYERKNCPGCGGGAGRNLPRSIKEGLDAVLRLIQATRWLGSLQEAHAVEAQHVQGTSKGGNSELLPQQVRLIHVRAAAGTISDSQCPGSPAILVPPFEV